MRCERRKTLVDLRLVKESMKSMFRFDPLTLQSVHKGTFTERRLSRAKVSGFLLIVVFRRPIGT